MTELPRLLLCTLDAVSAPSGASRRLASTLRALAQRFHVDVLTPGGERQAVETPLHGARLLHVASAGQDLATRLRAYEQAVAQQVTREQYAVAHFTDPFSGAVLLGLTPPGSLRRVYEALTFPSTELPLDSEGDASLRVSLAERERRCLQGADLVITGSRVTEVFIRTQRGDGTGVEVLPTPVSPGPATLPYRAGQAGAIRCIYVGSQAPWQGLDVLLQGLALAAQEVDVQLTVLGPRHPETQPRLDALVTELGLGPRVRFLPPVPPQEVPARVAEADVALLPLADVERNRAHGGPLAKVGDYIAAGRPVIAADLPVVRERLPEAGVRLFPAGDARALGEALVQLARDPGQRERMARAMVAAAVGAEAEPGFEARLGTLYDGLLAPRRSPAPPSAPLSSAAPAALGAAPLPEPASRLDLPGPLPLASSPPRMAGAPPAVAAEVRGPPPSPPARPRPRIGGGRAGAPPPPMSAAPPATPPGVSLARTAVSVPPPLPAPPPLPRRSAPPLSPAAALAAADEAELLEAIDLEEVEEVGGSVSGPPLQAPPPPPEIEEVPVDSRLDPWLAHIVQGYSPPGRSPPASAAPLPAPRLLSDLASGNGDG